MAYISKINLPNNEQYDFKDAESRTLIQSKIVVSASQPASSAQVTGDIWIVLVDDEQQEEED